MFVPMHGISAERDMNTRLPKLFAAGLCLAIGAGGVTTSSGAPAPVHASCPVFPADNPWNRDISRTPKHLHSDRIIASITASGNKALHADFGGGGAYGIPFVTVGSTMRTWPVVYTAYGDESDPGPFPIPRNSPVEGGATSDGDRHVIVVQRGTCRLYELYRAFWRGDHWEADSGATWRLRTNELRPRGWTSADAAGLPIFPGLARCEDIATGAINHALRVTFERTRRGWVSPARHFASSSTDSSRPAMGMRFRLKASYDISRFHGQARIVLTALKKYGMLVADNGSNWFITGAAQSCWNDEDLDQLKRVPGSAFEVVDTGRVVTE
jgi:hypothetical protein